MLREVETEESEVVMEEIAHPNPQGEHQEQRLVAHILQREHSLPYSAHRSFHLIIYREPTQQNHNQDDCGNGADERHDITHEGESVEDTVETRSRAVEERTEHTHLEQQGDAGNAEHQQGIDGPFRDHRSQ